MTAILVTLALIFLIVGLLGTILPAIPGLPLMFAGAWLLAYTGDYQIIGTPALIALVPVMPEAPPAPLPTISVASSAAGFTVSLNVAGAVKMSVSGDLGSFTAGTTVLTQQATIKEGFLTLSSNGNTSAATSQYAMYTAIGTSAKSAFLRSPQA